MGRAQFLFCLFGISVALLFNDAQAHSARRLSGEGIQGGDDASEGQFPYQVSLETDGYSFCGGSIYSDRYVITAAHCVVNDKGVFEDDSIKVVAGISNLKSTNKVAVDVIEVYVPKDYDPTKKGQVVIGDIAVLKLNKDLGIAGNSKLKKVKLPAKTEIFNEVDATVSGFGLNSIEVVTNPKTGKQKEKHGKRKKKLRYATAKVINNQDCRKHHKVIDKHMCAAIVQRKKDQPEGLCSGDSGGPLVYNGFQIGVISSSPFGCREDTEPAIYTRVTSYIDFINKVVGGKTSATIRSHKLKIEA